MSPELLLSKTLLYSFQNSLVYQYDQSQPPFVHRHDVFPLFLMNGIDPVRALEKY